MSLCTCLECSHSCILGARRQTRSDVEGESGSHTGLRCNTYLAALHLDKRTTDMKTQTTTTIPSVRFKAALRESAENPGLFLAVYAAACVCDSKPQIAPIFGGRYGLRDTVPEARSNCEIDWEEGFRPLHRCTHLHGDFAIFVSFVLSELQSIGYEVNLSCSQYKDDEEKYPLVPVLG